MISIFLFGRLVMDSRASGAFVVAFLLSGILGPAAAEPDDVLLRTPKLWDSMERIHRQAVTARVGEISDAGTFTADVNLGYRAEVRIRLHTILIFQHVFHHGIRDVLVSASAYPVAFELGSFRGPVELFLCCGTPHCGASTIKEGLLFKARYVPLIFNVGQRHFQLIAFPMPALSVSTVLCRPLLRLVILAAQATCRR